MSAWVGYQTPELGRVRRKIPRAPDPRSPTTPRGLVAKNRTPAARRPPDLRSWLQLTQLMKEHRGGARKRFAGGLPPRHLGRGKILGGWPPARQGAGKALPPRRLRENHGPGVRDALPPQPSAVISREIVDSRSKFLDFNFDLIFRSI